MALVSQNPGKLDQRLQLQSLEIERDASGGNTKVYVAIATVWAAWFPQGGSEFQAAEAEYADATGIFRIRFRDDVTQEWRVVRGDDVFDIIVPLAIGRRDYLDLVVKALNQTPGSSLSVELLHDSTPVLLEDGSFQLMNAAA